MPLVRIALKHGKAEAFHQAVSHSVHRALVETYAAPENGRLQIVTEHNSGELIHDPEFAGIGRSDDFIVIEVAASDTRTPEQKRAFYDRVANLLREAPGVRPHDLVIILIDVPKENWFFGHAD